MITLLKQSFTLPGLVLLCVLFVFCSSPSQEPGYWISHPTHSTQENLWLSFRSDFQSSSTLSEINLHIAVDSKYWLYINEKLVVYEGGLKRGPNRTDTYYDIVDIAPFVKKGNNKIEVLIWFWGREGFSHKNSGKAGLFIESQDSKVKLVTDDQWEVAVHPAYYTTEIENPNYRLPEFNVAFDANQTQFDWKSAEVIGERGVAPWNDLRERPIPLWKDLGLTAYEHSEVIETDSTLVVIGKLPKNISISPYFKIKSGKGGKIDIRTDNYIGGSEPNLRGEYITKDGEQEYESIGYLNGHEVIYTFPLGTEVLDLKYRETKYDTDYVGYFLSNNEDLNALWVKSANTMNVNMRDAIQDPDRERAQWWGDVVIILGEIFYTCDQNGAKAVKKAIYNLLEWQKEDGVIFSPIPAGNWDKELPAQMLASIGEFGIWRYYLYTGDIETLEFSYPYIQKYLDLWEFDDDGLVVHRPGGWSWYDWGQGIDVPVLDNLWMYQALTAVSKMANELGKELDAQKYSEQAASLKKVIKEKFWKGDRFASEGYQGRMDDRANGLAVALGLVNHEEWSKMKDELFRTRLAGPYMEKYTVEAFYKMGDAELATKRMMERYADMIASPVTTLWEGWVVGSGTYGGGSYNHGWSGWPITMAGEYLAGVSFSDIGYKKLKIEPRLEHFDQLSFSTPVNTGILSLEYKKDRNILLYIVELDEKIDSEFVLAKTLIEQAKTVKVNDQLINMEEEKKSSKSKSENEGSFSFSFNEEIQVEIQLN